MNKLILLFLSLLLLSCKQQPARQFSKDNVSFTVPEGWHITEQEAINGKGYYLSCEKQGLNASGLFILTWVNDSLALDEMLQQYISQITENFAAKGATATVSNILPATFGKYKGVGANYHMTLLKVPHEGHARAFYGRGKTLVAVMQEATEDAGENKKGFGIIEQSLSCP